MSETQTSPHRTRLLVGIGALVVVVIAVALLVTRPWESTSTPDTAAPEPTTEPGNISLPVEEQVAEVEVTSLFGQATETNFAAAQTVELQPGTVDSVSFRSPATPGYGTAQVAVRVAIYSGDPFAGLASLTELGSIALAYTRTEEPATRDAVFSPPVDISEPGEYVVVIEWVSSEPDELGGYEPITVLSGNAYPNGRGFNLRTNGVTNPAMWEDLDYLVSLTGSAVPAP